MKEKLQRLAARIDALSLRERVMLFAAAAAVYVFLMYFLGLGPMFAKQDLLRNQIVQQQNNLEGIDNEISDKVKAAQVDPDAPARERVAAVRAQTEALAVSLRAMQNGLVPPERMAPLVEAILRSNGRLQLASMRTLPVEPVYGSAKPAAAASTANAATAVVAEAQAAAKPAALLYRHGVEVTVRGNYPDMIGYMAALESMPTQLFWGSARLETETWPTSRLTLTLYTLSLDAKWMKL
jgi:MSHA biogenesis protein MshJ